MGISADSNRRKTGLLIGLAGVLINGVIFVLEFFSGRSTGSTTLIADAFHNSADGVSALMTVLSFLITEKPADRKHPFGFGRVEYLCSLLVGMGILGIGLFFVRSSVEKTLNPPSVQFSTTAFALMLLSIPLKLLYSLLNRKYARRVSSQTLTAASLDALGDVLVLSAAAFSLLFTKLSGLAIDGPLGLVVSGFLLFSGYSVVRRAAASLIGNAPEPAVVEMISSAICKSRYVIGIHDLVVHDYGPQRRIASVHAEVPSRVPLETVALDMEQAERNLKERGIELVVHVDPVAAQKKPPCADPFPLTAGALQMRQTARQ
jgi:cation diffusion facilitator family transporter